MGDFYLTGCEGCAVIEPELLTYDIFTIKSL